MMNAHIPFIPHDDRPVSIDEGSREVRVPHETGISLRTRDHREADKRMSMADLMTESNYLNPDVEIIAEINTPESFATFGESMSTGHGVVGTTHAETMERLTNRVIEQGLPPHLLPEIDLVVFPRHVDGQRYVGEVVEPVSDTASDSTDATTIERDGVTVTYNTVLRRTPDGGFTVAYDHPVLGDSKLASRLHLFERLAERTDRSVEGSRRRFAGSSGSWNRSSRKVSRRWMCCSNGLDATTNRRSATNTDQVGGDDERSRRARSGGVRAVRP